MTEHPNHVPCSIKGCGKPHKARGWCAMHYRRWRRHGDVQYVEANRLHDGRCQIDGCEAPYMAKGYCYRHYYNWRHRGDPLRDPRVPGQKKWVSDSGYVMVQRRDHPNAHKSSGTIMQHRLLISEHIGRPLYADETVHHKNGVRTDNRLENLELRVGNHGKGGKAEDMLAWAHEMIRRYEGRL